MPTDQGWIATTPSWRTDLSREVDLIEEVARIRGYDLIPTQSPQIAAAHEGTDPFVHLVRRLRERAAAAGMIEARNYAFLAPHELRAARVPADAVPVVNPLSEERSVLRTALLPGLLSDLLRAQRHQVESVALFELAHVFRPSDGALPNETTELGLLLSGSRDTWLGKGENVDFYDIKGRLEAVLADVPLTFGIDEKLAENAPFLHPRRSARIHANGRNIGLLGELHPDVLDATAIRGRAVYAAIDVDALAGAIRDLPIQAPRPLPKFPAVMRDIALVVAADLQAGVVAATIQSAAAPLAENVELFDLYQGAPIPDGSKSLAFRVIYRDPNGTLTDARVDETHRKVEKRVTETFKAAIRVS